jgi:hypothetical protein
MDTLEAVMPNLVLYQGYLVPKDLDLSQTSLDKARSDPRVPDVTYATIKVGVIPATATPSAPPPKPDTTADDATPSSTPAKKKKTTKP